MSQSEELEKINNLRREVNKAEIELEGKTYTATSILAHEFGYDQDHIGLLARQGKINGFKLGKNWFVLRDSLAEYKNRVEEEKKLHALKSIIILRRPVVPSIALSQTADVTEPSRVNLRAVTQSALKFILLGLFVFVTFSSLYAFAKNDVLKEFFEFSDLVYSKYSNFKFKNPAIAFLKRNVENIDLMSWAENFFGDNLKNLSAIKLSQIESLPSPTPTPTLTSIPSPATTPTPTSVSEPEFVEISKRFIKIIGGKNIYLNNDGVLRFIPDSLTLSFLNFTQSELQEIPQDVFEFLPKGSPIASVTIQKSITEELIGSDLISIRGRIENLESKLASIDQIVTRNVPVNDFSGNVSTPTQVGSTDAELTGQKLTVDNIKIDGNAISATSGNVELPATIKLNSVAYTWPSADGSANQRLTTNGSGTLSWATVSGGGGGVSSNSLDFDEFVNTMLLDANLTINRGGFFIGLGAVPSTVLEVQGTASASYLLTGNTIQVGGYSSAAYSRFGTAATDHAGSIDASNDLLISGDLEVNGSAAFDGILSFYGEIAPDGITCSNGQILKKTGANDWDCASDATGGGGGGTFQVRDFPLGTTVSNVATISFDAGAFNISASASVDAVVKLDYANGPASRAANETITGDWVFNNDILLQDNSISRFIFASTSLGRFGFGDTTPETFFEVASSSGIVASISNTFFVDANNQRIGIGTTSPTFGLQINTGVASDPTFGMSDGDVAHSMTALVPADVFGRLTTAFSTAGGLSITGFSDDVSTTGLNLTGAIGSTNPTDTTAAVEIVGKRFDGVTNVTAMNNTDMVLGVYNNTTLTLAILGNGNVGIGIAAPTTKLEIVGTASSSKGIFTNELNVALGNAATVAYSRFGIAATDHAGSIDASNDLLISGDLEVNGSAAFDGILSFYGEIAPDGITCSNGQILKKTGANDWDCAADAGGSVSSNSLNFDEFQQALITDQDTTITVSSSLTFNLNTDDDLIIQEDGVSRWAFIRDSTGRFGLGDTTPETFFEIASSSGIVASISNTLSIDATDKRVGIGTTLGSDPADKLHVFGSSAVLKLESTSGSSPHLKIIKGDAGGFATLGFFTAGTRNFLISSFNDATFRITEDTATDNDLVFNSSRIGIGTTTPTTKLEIVGTASSSKGIFTDELNVALGNVATVAYSRFGIDATSRGLSAASDVLISGKLEVNSSATFENQFVIKSTIDTLSVASISATSLAGGTVFNITVPASTSAAARYLFIKDTNGVAYASLGYGGRFAIARDIRSDGSTTNCTGPGTPSAGCIDLAEEFLTPENLESGELVSLDLSNTASESSVKKSSKPYDENIIGIVSTKPGIVLGSNVHTGKNAEGYKAPEGKTIIALVGRVPLKVSNENGEIKKGDYLTSSSVPGVAMKATKPGRVIGIALESSKLDSGKNTIMTFINPHWLGKNEDIITQLANLTNPAVTSSEVNINNIVSSVVDYLRGAVLTVKTLIAELIKTQILEVEKGIIIKDKITGEPYCVEVISGQILANKGSCEVMSSPTPEPSLSPEPTPLESPVPDPGPEPSPELTPSLTPEPSLEPTPESSLEPAPEIIPTQNEEPQ